MQVKTFAQQLLYTTVRIVTQGAPEGSQTGTGFIFGYPDPEEPDASYQFIVTNKHVVKGSTSFTYAINVSDGDRPRLGSRIQVNGNALNGPGWRGHPDPEVDIAVWAFGEVPQKAGGAGLVPFYRAVGMDSVPTLEMIEQSDALEEVVFAGYPDGLFDSVNLSPILRRGITATPPHFDYCGKPIVLIDAAVFPGSSGSPVFVRRPLGPAYFLGVLSQGFRQWSDGRLKLVPIPTGLVPIPVSQQLINLGVVYKARTVVETVEHALREEGAL